MLSHVRLSILSRLFLNYSATVSVASAISMSKYQLLQLLLVLLQLLLLLLLRLSQRYG